MAKPVLYLTNNISEAVRQLRPQAQRYNLGFGRGVFKSGDEFIIRRADTAEDAKYIRGFDISRFEVIGYAHPAVIEMAKTLVKGPMK